MTEWEHVDKDTGHKIEPLEENNLKIFKVIKSVESYG